MRLPLLVLSLLLAIAPSLADARNARLEAPQQYVFVTPAGQPATMEGLRSSIATAGSFRGWQVIEDAPGRLTMKNVIRGKHTVVVAVVYDTAGFRIEYVSSENLDYEEKRGQAYIHPKYQQWVANLALDINTRVSAP